MPLIAESPFSWSKNSISIPKSEVSGGLKFVGTCANFPATLATCDFASSVRVSHKSDSGTKTAKLGLKLDRRIWLSRALPYNSAMSQKSNTPDGYSFQFIAMHLLERTLYTLSKCCDIQTNRLKLPFPIGSYLRLSHVNEIIVPVPIAQCTVSDYR